MGKHRYRISSTPTFTDKLLAATSACEGGSYGGVNCYDRCILTVGAIQKCEAATIYGVSALLGACAERNAKLLQSYLDEIPGSCTFKRSVSGGRWRFFYNGAEVVTKAQQRAIFLGGASGYKGQWTEDQKAHARRVCAVMSAIWQEEVFRWAQDSYNAKVILAYVTPRVKRILFPAGHPTGRADGALRAAYVTFAVNNPSRADKHFMKAYESQEYKDAKSAYARLVLVLRELTFGPGIAIYPARYEAIRPVLEREFGVDLPDFAEELKTWYEDPNRTLFPDATSIQRELIAQGYDLGPAEADGKIGPKTRAAIETFEREAGLPNPDGVPDVRFTTALAAAQKVRLDEEEQDAAPSVPHQLPDDDELQKPEDLAKPPPEPEPEPEPEPPPEDKPLEPVEALSPDEPPMVVDPRQKPEDEKKDEKRGPDAWVVMVLALSGAVLAGLGHLASCF